MIELRNVTKVYVDQTGRKIEALKGVSLGIQSGEFVTVFGDSGSGKSTLVFIIAFLLSLTKGEYSFSGKKVESKNRHTLTRLREKYLGVIFQDYLLLDHLNVLRNVCLPLRFSNFS